MRVIITLVLFLSLLSFAQETGASVESSQTAALALDSIEENTVGFSLNGRAKGGILSSTLDSKDWEESFSEYAAFSDFLLSISVRPSNETKATFDLRFHKDWQSAYREGNNTPIIRWWSYDGNVLDKKLKFNLGTMRIAYTPLTIYLPEPDFIMEPEIFALQRKEAMEERYLDGTNRRLLQGLNLEYGIKAGIFDKLFLQGTIARLRRVADQTDRIFFDFAPNKDRYSMAARIGAEAFGLSVGLSDVYTFNRVSSSTKNTDSLYYENNKVLSFELNYNSKKLFSGPVGFGIGAEYALSSWEHLLHERMPAEAKIALDYAMVEVGTPIPGIPSVVAPDGRVNYYPYYKSTIAGSSYKYKLSTIEKLHNKGALLGNAFVSYSDNPLEAKLAWHFLNTDKDFEAELAASPAYLPNLPILNSDGAFEPSYLQQFRTGSLENMYYSLYYTLPLNAITMVYSNPNLGHPGTPDKILAPRLYQTAYLDNNYKLAHYYRNAYTQQTYTRLERSDSIASLLDPAVNMALPYGYATPDRSGGDADLSFSWNKAVNVKGVFGMYSSEHLDYTRFGGGLEVDIARLAGLGKALIISGSYEQNKEKKGFYPQTDRIMAGAKIGIWRGLSLTGGFQLLSKEFENSDKIYYDPDDPDAYWEFGETSEMLAIGGPQIKISERANFTLLGGLLSNTVSYVLNGERKDLALNKYIVSGTVTVEF